MAKLKLPRLAFWLFGAAGVVAIAASACSSTPNVGRPAQCNTNPWMCDPGLTCWPTACACPSGQASCDATTCVAQFGCVNALVGTPPYNPCHNSAAAVSCGDHQACIEVTSSTGRCLPYCDPTNPAHACAADALCVEYQVGSAAGAPTVHVCVTNVPDGGMGGDADRPDVIVPFPDGSSDVMPQPQ